MPKQTLFYSLSGLLLISTIVTTGLTAGEADVVDVRVQRSADQTYRFDVSVQHADEGWDHYANRWEVVAPDGTVLATRTLLHPHEHEQPFTRSLSGVTIADGITRVMLRAHDSQHAYGGTEISVAIPD